MAFIAVLGELSPMNVFVAESALSALDQVRAVRFSSWGIPGIMALLAIGDIRVFTGQGISGLGVVKFFRLPIDQQKFRSLVFRMAAGASIFLVFVEAGSGFDPLGELLVTGKAFLVDRFCSRSVALRAVVQAGIGAVSLAELARRNQELGFLP
jgi:hypothetical protein